MLIAFLGDIHGRIFHAMAALVTWQKKNGKKFNLIVQAGDFGAFPYPDEYLLNNRFVKKDPTELDFSRFIESGSIVHEFTRLVESEIETPIHFIRGNHEDFNWLDSLEERNGICDIDELGLVKYIKDGTIHRFMDINIAFLGGADFGSKDKGIIDQEAFERLMETEEKIDILVSHEIYYGIGFSYHGITQGSRKITRLVEKLKPRYHITAHYHHMIGPHQRHGTVHAGLNNLVSPLRGKPGRNLKPGWLAVLDTEASSLKFAKDEWLTKMHTHMTVLDLKEAIE